MPDDVMGLVAAIAVAVVLGVAIDAARADVIVLQSQVVDIATGKVLQDDVVLHVPANRTVKLLLKPSNTTKTISGPFDGKVDEYGRSKLPNPNGRPTREFDAGTIATGSEQIH